MKKILLGSILLTTSIFASNMMKNNVVPLSGAAGSNGMVFPDGKSRIVVKSVFMDKNSSYNEDEELNDVRKRSMKINVNNLLYRQGFGNGFDMRVILPYVKKDSSMTNPMNSVTYDNKNRGLGDIKLIGRYQLLNQMKGDPLFLAVGFGVKLPSGSTNKTFSLPSGNSVVPTMELGTGSTDFISEIGLSKILPNSRIDGHIMYTSKQEGDNKYEFGDVLKWNIGYAYALNNEFDLALTFNGEKINKNKSNGSNVDYTGGTFMFLSPSVHYKINKKYDVSIAYSHMINRDNNFDSNSNIGGLSEDSRIILRLGYNF